MTALLTGAACRATPPVTAPVPVPEGPAARTIADTGAAPSPRGAPTGRFYTGKQYGSEAAFNPVSVVINEGFDILQVGSDRHVLRRDYASGARAVVRSLAAPGGTIRAYGVRDWLRNEVLPLTGNNGGGAAWVPNYMLHLVGSGMVSARLREWYAARGVPHAQALGVLTMYGAHVLNELNELIGFDGRSEDTITDLLLFDALGQVAFSVDAVQRAVSNPHVQLTSWQLQPSFVVPGQTLENVGQYFMLRVRPDTASPWGIIYTTGMNGVIGVSYLRHDGISVSVAAGTRSDSLVVVNTETNAKIAKLQRDAAFYVDRDNSLLLSLRWQHRDAADLSLNVYPGALGAATWMPGIWIQHRLAGGMQAGLAGRWTPGLGFGAGAQ